MSILDTAKRIPFNHNVSIKVLDAFTGEVISSHTGHNAVTNSMLTGIGHYLTGDGILNQGWALLNSYIPKYISLGTMGLLNQEQDPATGYPAGIGSVNSDDIGTRYASYMQQVPGYGADGYDANLNNNRPFFGLGPPFADRQNPDESLPSETLLIGDVNLDGVVNEADLQLLIDYTQGKVQFSEKQLLVANVNKDPDGIVNCEDSLALQEAILKGTTVELGSIQYTQKYIPTIDCELISTSFPRATISYREVIPETESELPQTIDVVFSALVSTGALAQFREPDKDYLFITEAGLWSRKDWVDGGDNGLIAGYRIAPPDSKNWYMSKESLEGHDDALIQYLKEVEHIEDPTSADLTDEARERCAAYNRDLLNKQIIRVGINQVVQIIWKVQLGGIEQLTGLDQIYTIDHTLKWINW